MPRVPRARRIPGVGILHPDGQQRPNWFCLVLEAPIHDALPSGWVANFEIATEGFVQATGGVGPEAASDPLTQGEINLPESLLQIFITAAQRLNRQIALCYGEGMEECELEVLGDKVGTSWVENFALVADAFGADPA